MDMTSRHRRRKPQSKKRAWLASRVGSPNIAVVDPVMAFRDQRMGPLSDVNRYPVETHNMLWEDVFDSDDDLEEELDELLMEVDGILEEEGAIKRKDAKRKGAKRSSVGSQNDKATHLLPIFHPLHNIREVCKQLVLLEDHLFHPKKRCADCIRKHLLKAEAFAEEAVTLDKDGQYTAVTKGLSDEIRKIARMSVKGEGRDTMAQAVRSLRKRLSKPSFDAVSEEHVSRGKGGSAAMAPAPSMLPPIPLPKLEGGEWVFYAYHAEGKQGIEGWYEGTTVPPGMNEMCGEYEVTRIPDEGWIPIRYADGCAWAKHEEVYPLSVKNRISKGLEGTHVTTYWTPAKAPPNGMRHPAWTEDKLRMADLIQSVLVNELRDICAIAGVSASECDRRVLGKIVPAAVINALYESNLDPTISPGDSGRSVGLFQLLDTGAGRGMTRAERENPIRNTQRIAREFVYRLTGEQPPWADTPYPKSTKLQKLIEREATGHLASTQWTEPSVGEWTEAWTTEVERPANAEAVALRRKRTADELFPPPKPTVPVTSASPSVARTEEPKVPHAPAHTTPVPTTAVVPAASKVTVRSKSLSDFGMDPKQGRDFKAEWANHHGVSVQIGNALLLEDRAIDMHRGAGTNKAYQAALMNAGDQWKQIGLETNRVWPFARAIALYTMAGSVPAAYGMRKLILDRHPGSSWATVARGEMVVLEREHPRAYLLSGGQQGGMSPLVKGVIAFLGMLGLLALL